MPKLFYRYVRPVKLDEGRLELTTLPRGGVCLRFQEMGDGALSFTHSRCHTDDLFSKEVAKRVADSRAAQYAKIAEGGVNPPPPTVPMAMDPAILVKSVIEACDAWDPTLFDLGHNFYVTYLKLELHELKTTLTHLIDSNTCENAKAKIWRAGIEAAKYAERYESLSR
jgi:hypothetical protein